ncbi:MULTISPECIES: hypothetical protein [Microbacterium]|uniref:hypothetical protein n=1 Tax=Microbacterium TaxID=33882 RepID=UPI002783474F|nr:MULTISPECIES: hypothetical protein [Microbacterium]MDQ1075077.1 hypothetical protein [Microbacterium sp. SORGH_AS_0969]MDQ1115308.1 hypothetical protein [Microbacterium testaceum]
MHPLVAPLTKLAAGALSLSVLLAGGVAVGTGWLSDTIDHRIRVASAGPDADNITWASLEDDPPAETIDVSTLIIAGRMNPTDGEQIP